MRKFYKSKSKAVKNAFSQHQKSLKFEILDCYLNPSSNKLIAMQNCKDLMNEFNGFDLRIISYNSFTFTVGFFGVIDNELNFFYITTDKIRYTEIENLI